MRVQITGRHMRVPAPMAAYAEGRAAALQHYDDRLTHIEVVLTQEGDRRTAEFVLHGDRRPLIVCHATDPRLRSAIDAAADRAARQLVKYKEKRVTRVSHRVPHRRTALRSARSPEETE